MPDQKTCGTYMKGTHFLTISHVFFYAVTRIFIPKNNMHRWRQRLKTQCERKMAFRYAALICANGSLDQSQELQAQH